MSFLYSSLHKIIPPRGPRNVLCVVVVTKSAYSTGFGCKPAATNPAICAMSTINLAFTSSAISLNFLKSIVLEYADAPATISLGLCSNANL